MAWNAQYKRNMKNPITVVERVSEIRRLLNEAAGIEPMLKPLIPEDPHFSEDCYFNFLATVFGRAA